MEKAEELDRQQNEKQRNDPWIGTNEQMSDDLCPLSRRTYFKRKAHTLRHKHEYEWVHKWEGDERNGKMNYEDCLFLVIPAVSFHIIHILGRWEREREWAIGSRGMVEIEEGKDCK